VNLMAASSILLRGRDVMPLGLFDPAYHLAGDWDLWLRLAESADLVALPRILVSCRWHGANASGQCEAMLRESIAAQESSLAVAAHPRSSGDAELSPYLATACSKLAGRWSQLGMLLARSGRRVEAITCQRRAIGLRLAVLQYRLRLLRSALRSGGRVPGGGL
jgi:hypothetical protein